MSRCGLFLAAAAAGLVLVGPARSAAPSPGQRPAVESPGALLRLDSQVLALVNPTHDSNASACHGPFTAVIAAARDPLFDRLPAATRRAVLHLVIPCLKRGKSAPGVDLLRRLEPLAETSKETADANELLLDDAVQRSDDLDAARRLVRVIDADPGRVAKWWPRYLDPITYADAVEGDAALSLAVFERLTALAWVDSGSQLEASTSWAVTYAGLLLDRGEVAAAERALARVLDADALMEVAESRRFEALWPRFEAAGRFDWRKVAEASLAANAARLAASPNHLDIVAEHLRILSRLGQYEVAIRLGQSYRDRLKTGEAFAASNRDADWMLSNLAGALLASGHIDEAQAVSLEAIAAGTATRRSVAMTLVWASRLDEIGRPAEALAMLDSIDPNGTTTYGQLWVDSERACALGQLADPRAEAMLDALPARWSDNPAAVIGAMICGDRLDEAAALFVRRLQDPRLRDDALASLRIMLPSPGDSAWKRLYLSRREAVLARPEVRRAVEAVGRRVEAPLHRS